MMATARARSGQALVEFALVLPIMVLLMVGGTQATVLIRDSMNLDLAAKEGAAEASAADATPGDGVQAAREFWSVVEPGSPPITVSAIRSGRFVVVTTSRSESLLAPFTSLTLRGRGQHTIEAFQPGSQP